MITIYEKSNLAEKILQKQLFNANKEYKKSNFVVSVQIEKDIVLFNNLTKKMVILTHEK